VEHSSISFQSSTATLDEAPSSLTSTQLTSHHSTLTELTTSVNLAPTDVLRPQVGSSNVNRSELKAELKIFFSTFFTIFLAELGDKTQVATLLMTAESHQPWIVFAGAGSALVATSLLGVWLGCWLAKRVSAKTLEKSAGVLLLLVATQLLWEVFHL
jgi:Ca2+/H+ antiporter, TMEM165/GDT1 family